MSTARRQRHESGFSLVEVMVVIAVIALVSVVAVTQITPPRSAAETEAGQLALRLEMARRHVLATGSLIGVSVDADGGGYAFMDLHREGWRVRHGDRTLGPVRLAEGVRLTLAGGQSANAATGDALPVPDFWFDPLGSEPPVVLELRGAGRDYRLTVSALRPVEVSDAR
ncbi:GspH/FimT family protein [Glycocaulis abyssi]|uniref:Type II secretion system protein H n=1 Tax=Glycocaulis abyssi TaxID=1433403 RepID=A0ABV9NAC0_9PROT